VTGYHLYNSLKALIIIISALHHRELSTTRSKQCPEWSVLSHIDCFSRL